MPDPVPATAALHIDGHPRHTTFVRHPAGITLAFPEPATGVLGWKIRRRCRKQGGHWWHPSDPMIEWRCCNCGAVTDGMPKDGT